MKVSLRSFLKRHWLTIIVVLVGYAVSNHFYKKSIAKPELVFLIDPVRTKIIESKHILETPLRVVRINGDEIKGNVTSVRFYFWNNGRKSIKKSNILEPLVITLDDPNGEILDYKILKCSRKVVKPIVGLNSVDPNKSLSLSFAILEQEDGLTGQVIYKGEPEAKLVIYGTIEGVQKILTDASIIQRGWPKEIIKDIGLPVSAILLIAVFTICSLYIEYKLKGTPTKIKTEVIIIIAISTIALIVILSKFKGKIETAKREALTSVIQKAPKDIIP